MSWVSGAPAPLGRSGSRVDVSVAAHVDVNFGVDGVGGVLGVDRRLEAALPALVDVVAVDVPGGLGAAPSGYGAVDGGVVVEVVGRLQVQLGRVGRDREGAVPTAVPALGRTVPGRTDLGRTVRGRRASRSARPARSRAHPVAERPRPGRPAPPGRRAVRRRCSEPARASNRFGWRPRRRRPTQARPGRPTPGGRRPGRSGRSGRPGPGPSGSPAARTLVSRQLNYASGFTRTRCCCPRRRKHRVGPSSSSNASRTASVANAIGVLHGQMMPSSGTSRAPSAPGLR